MADRRRDQRLADLFQRAVLLAPDERAALAERECAGDPALRAELLALLREDARGTAGALRGTALRPPPPEIERVGDFRLLAVLGEGGMGVVYLAEQEAPVRRQVALKMIRFGLQTPEVAARFERERQALARMNHPCIAEIYASGTTEAGRPWFAMEYVPGPPMDRHCDAARLSIEERLKLFCRVCDGVQHAHQKGVIHRDLKPTNVLVTSIGGSPAPRIIDFGVAEAVVGTLSSADYRTTLGRVVGTYLYMSPEQADPDPADVDTRTDVYSLGVMLYELLTGASPYREEVVRAGDPATLQRAVLEDEPQRPSARAAARAGDPAGAQAAAARRGTPRGLARRLAGDLDWIVLKALEKQRERRYGSASELRADIERYQADLPVSAGPPSTSYRIRRFVRRHRVPVAALALALVSLLCVLAAVSVAWRKSTVALAAEQARSEAVARKAQDAADRLRFFQRALFDAPTELNAEPLVDELLDNAARDIPSLFGASPASEAGVRQAVGKYYLALGQAEKAREQLLGAYAIQTGPLAKNDLDVFATLDALIRASRLCGGVDAAEPYVRHSLELAVRLAWERDPALGAALAALAAARDRGAAGAPSVQEVHALLESLDPRSDTAAFASRVLLEVSLSLHRAGHVELGEAYFAEMEAVARRDVDGTGLILLLWRFADTYQRYAPELPGRGVELALELQDAIEGKLAESHWMHAEARRLLGLSLARMDPVDFERAERALLEARDLAESTLEPRSAHLRGAALALDELVRILLERGLFEAFLADSWSRWSAGPRATPWWPAARPGLPSRAAAAVRAFLEEAGAAAQ